MGPAVLPSSGLMCSGVCEVLIDRRQCDEEVCSSRNRASHSDCQHVSMGACESDSIGIEKQGSVQHQLGSADVITTSK